MASFLSSLPMVSWLGRVGVIIEEGVVVGGQPSRRRSFGCEGVAQAEDRGLERENWLLVGVVAAAAIDTGTPAGCVGGFEV